jgi:hypothetical protein
VAPTLLVVASSSDLEKSCTLPDHALRCDEFHTTSLRCRDAEKAFFPSTLRIACCDICGLLSPCDHLGHFRGLYAHIGDYEQIGHCLRLLHGDLLHSLDITDPVVEGIDDLDILDVWDSIPGIAKIFPVVPETFIMLFRDGLQGLCYKWMHVCAMQVPTEHGT